MPIKSIGATPTRRLVTRQEMAELISAEVYETSHRTLENEPIPYKLVNGRAMYDPEVGLDYARRKVAESPAFRGGRRRRAA